MASALLVPVEEYVAHTYEPDMDYDEGVLIGRHVGQQIHSRLQALTVTHLCNHEKEWGIRVLVEQRIQVAPRKYCVADICATLATTRREPILKTPPLFTIEILSPDDEFADVETKAEKYLAIGVQYVWTVDPKTGRCWRHDADHSMRIVERSVLRVEGTAIEIPIADLVAQI